MVTIEGDGFVEDEVSNVRAIGTITAPGRTVNTIAYDTVESFLAGNYSIEKREGTLVVNAAPAPSTSPQPDTPATYIPPYTPDTPLPFTPQTGGGQPAAAYPYTPYTGTVKPRFPYTPNTGKVTSAATPYTADTFHLTNHLIAMIAALAVAVFAGTKQRRT